MMAYQPLEDDIGTGIITGVQLKSGDSFSDGEDLRFRLFLGLLGKMRPNNIGVVFQHERMALTNQLPYFFVVEK